MTLLTLTYILDHAVCCTSAGSSGRSLNLIISQLRSNQSSSNCPNHGLRASLLRQSPVNSIGSRHLSDAYLSIHSSFSCASIRRLSFCPREPLWLSCQASPSYLIMASGIKYPLWSPPHASAFAPEEAKQQKQRQKQTTGQTTTTTATTATTTHKPNRQMYIYLCIFLKSILSCNEVRSVRHMLRILTCGPKART